MKQRENEAAGRLVCGKRPQKRMQGKGFDLLEHGSLNGMLASFPSEAQMPAQAGGHHLQPLGKTSPHSATCRVSWVEGEQLSGCSDDRKRPGILAFASWLSGSCFASRVRKCIWEAGESPVSKLKLVSSKQKSLNPLMPLVFQVLVLHDTKVVIL